MRIQPIARARHCVPPSYPPLAADEVGVRPYRPRDRDALYHICAETALMGRPQEMTAEARAFLIHAIIGYYPAYEPESAWVAEVRGDTVGYIVGAVDTGRFNRYQKRFILPGTARALLLGGFPLTSAKNRRTMWTLAKAAWRKELQMPDVSDEYPAHLHTNLLAGYRGWGLGRRMMESYLAYLLDRGVPGVHLGTTSYNKEALPFYERMGFTEIWRGRASFFEGVIPEDVDLLTLAQKLS